jgi:uncharacterized membrane protein YoaK (UPF0700 family)
MRALHGPKNGRRPRRGSRLVKLARFVTAHHRTGASDLLLATALAFVAGSANAGGFLAIGLYTSHMTGVVSAITDNIALGALGLVGSGLAAVVAFVAGAGLSAILINWGRRHLPARQYAYPLLVEATLLLAFGLLGTAGQHTPGFAWLAGLLLCFIMGLQNATITKISGARIRTTHLTGMITDIGIELGKALYKSVASTGRAPIRFDAAKLFLLSRVVGAFFIGGVVGAFGYGYAGYLFSLPLAVILLALAAPSMSPGKRPAHMSS